MQRTLNGPMAGKTVLVTGGTSGIGRATAQGLSLLGARVAIAGRDDRRTHDVARDISSASGAPVQAFVADLSSQGQVRRLAEEVLHALPRIDVLVNNAGGYWSTRHLTVDGYEHTFALNHLAPFLLTHLLLDRMRAGPGARVVNVASGAQAAGRIDFDDLQGARSYSGSRAYNQSKLASVLFTYELARRLGGTAVTANALHPGVVSTAFGGEDPGRAQRLLVPLMRPFMKSPARGAATSVHCACAPELDRVSGAYFVDSRIRRSSKRSYDEPTAARLWQVSADLVGLPFSPSLRTSAS
jgi:NAD(P)-dependent dehydrogenase (short-subunit alcohol dehydrogenase family)